MPRSPKTNTGMDEDALKAVTSRYEDASRIKASVSATGQGYILRWQYSEDNIQPEAKAQEPVRDATPFHGSDVSGSSSSSAFSVDEDGDSEMGDENGSAEEPSTGVARGLRMQTPQPVGPYDPGSVVLTPRKDTRHSVRRARRSIESGPRGRGPSDGFQERVALLRQDTYLSPEDLEDDTLARAFSAARRRSLKGKLVEPVSRHTTKEDMLRIRALLQNLKKRHSSPSELSSQSSGSEWSRATIIVDDDDEDERPTLRDGELPTIRHDNPMPAQPPRRRVTHEEEEQMHIHLFKDDDGNWVRSGSLGPGAIYPLTEADLPPKESPSKKRVHFQAGSSSSSSYDRTDTESVSSRAPSAAPEPSPVVKQAVVLRRSARIYAKAHGLALAAALEGAKAKGTPARRRR